MLATRMQAYWRFNIKKKLAAARIQSCHFCFQSPIICSSYLTLTDLLYLGRLHSPPVVPSIMPPIKIKLSDAANSDQTKQADLNKEDNVVVTATHDSEVERRLAKFKSDYQSSFDNLIEAFISEKRELEGKLKSAQQQIVQLTSMSEKMELEEKLKSAQQEVMQLTEDIERIAGIQHRAPDLDNALESQFMDLREQVRSFTLNFCDRPISSPSTPLKLPARVKQALAAVSGVSTARLLSSALHARYFVQALIWRLLCDNLLTNPFLIWGQNEEVGNFVRRVQSMCLTVLS